MSGRLWTADEIASLRAHAGDPCVRVAQALSRSLKSICSMREICGITRRHAVMGKPIDAFIRAKHALGWSDAEIASAWHCARETVGIHRRGMGLPHNAISHHRRQLVREKTIAQCQDWGVKNLGELRREAYRRQAVRAGWPADLRFRSVQILNALWDGGPMTRQQLAAKIGMPWKGSRPSLASNDPQGSYLAHLIARGLVVCLSRACKRTGQGKSVSLYSLPINIQRQKVS